MEAVDRAVLERLADELGDPEAVVEIVRGYLDLLPTRLDELDAPPTDESDPDEADPAGSAAPRRRAAHTLKSGALLLGARALAAAAAQVEQGAGSSDEVRREARAAARDWRRWLAFSLARNPHHL